jgi:hypothetical protein
MNQNSPPPYSALFAGSTQQQQQTGQTNGQQQVQQPQYYQQGMVQQQNQGMMVPMQLGSGQQQQQFQQGQQGFYQPMQVQPQQPIVMPPQLLSAPIDTKIVYNVPFKVYGQPDGIVQLYRDARVSVSLKIEQECSAWCRNWSCWCAMTLCVFCPIIWCAEGCKTCGHPDYYNLLVTCDLKGQLWRQDFPAVEAGNNVPRDQQMKNLANLCTLLNNERANPYLSDQALSVLLSGWMKRMNDYDPNEKSKQQNEQFIRDLLVPESAPVKKGFLASMFS